MNHSRRRLAHEALADGHRYSADNARWKAECGSGLGLSIVERIAALHGARVALGDGPLGKGLRVTLTFPAGAASR